MIDSHPIVTVALLRLILQTAPPLNDALPMTAVRWRERLVASALGLPVIVMVFFIRLAAAPQRVWVEEAGGARFNHHFIKFAFLTLEGGRSGSRRPRRSSFALHERVAVAEEIFEHRLDSVRLVGWALRNVTPRSRRVSSVRWQSCVSTTHGAFFPTKSENHDARTNSTSVCCRGAIVSHRIPGAARSSRFSKPSFSVNQRRASS